MDPEGFSVYVEDLVEAGANAIGGCCGTSPEFIKALKNKAAAYMPVQVEENVALLLLTEVRCRLILLCHLQ